MMHLRRFDFFLLLLMVKPGISLSSNKYQTELNLTVHGNDLRFIVMGDWGDDTAAQHQVSGAMGKWCETHQCEFILALGDNFYMSGVYSADSDRFKSTWSDIYTHYGIASLPWYVIAGNHDHGNSKLLEDGHEWFQVEHSEIDSQWVFPDLAYSLNVEFDGAKVKFVNIDTESIRHDVNEPDAMIEFLDDQLNDTEADWKIVSGHHPCYTAAGSFGDGKEIRDKVLPVMKAYKTDIYLAGHEHNQQHFQAKDDPVGIDHIITGGGGYHHITGYNEEAYQESVEEGMEMLSFDDNYGFTYMIINDDSITWQFVNYDLVVVYEYSRLKLDV